MLGPASLVSANSTIGAIGVAIMPTPMVDPDAFAISIMPLCLGLMRMSTGAGWNISL